MEDYTIIKGIIDLAQTSPLAAVLYLLWKSGDIGRRKNGVQCQINDLKSHAKVANDEMKIIKEDISGIKSDVSFIRGKLSK